MNETLIWLVTDGFVTLLYLSALSVVVTLMIGLMCLIVGGILSKFFDW